MRDMDEFISLQDAIDEATRKLGMTSSVVKILNGVMEVMLASDEYASQDFALDDLEELCR